MAFPCHFPCLGLHRSVSGRVCPWNTGPRGYLGVRGGFWGQLGLRMAGETSLVLHHKLSRTLAQLPEESQVSGASLTAGPRNPLSPGAPNPTRWRFKESWPWGLGAGLTHHDATPSALSALPLSACPPPGAPASRPLQVAWRIWNTLVTASPEDLYMLATIPVKSVLTSAGRIRSC